MIVGGVAACVVVLVVLYRQGESAAAVWAGILGGIASIAAVMVAVLPVRPPGPAEIVDEEPVPPGTVPRPAEISAVVKALLAASNGDVTLLYGAPGNGKTTLTYSVRNDPRVQRRFGRRVYRVTVGRGVSGDAAIAAKVGEAIRVLGGEDRFTDPEQGGRQLGMLLDTRRRCLLILDDVWTPDQLAPFTTGGRRCARLVTTRSGSLPAARRVEVGGLPDDQARDLLGEDLPPLRTDLMTELLEVTRRWPLLLRLANKSLVSRVRAGDQVTEAAADFLEKVRVLGPGAPDSAAPTVELDNPTHRVRSVEATLLASLALLKTPDSERLQELAVFSPGQVIPFSLAAALWAETAQWSRQDAVRVVEALGDVGLASWVGGGRLRLHEVISDYLRSKLTERQLTDLHGSLVDGAGALLPPAEPLAAGQAAPARAWWQPGMGPSSENASDAERYLDENLLYHLMRANRISAAEDLVCDLRWILHRLQVTGAASALADLETVGTDRARDLGGVIRRVLHMLGEEAVSTDAIQFVLNALRSEAGWADQAAALQGMRPEPALVSRWPLPDNPGSALLYVCNAPGVWSERDNGVTVLSPDGSCLLMAGRGGVYLCDSSARRITQAFPVAGGGWTQTMAISPDSSRVAVVGAAGAIVVRDMHSWEVRAQGGDDGALWSVAFTADGASLITTGNDGRIKQWNARTLERIRPGEPHFFPRFDLDSSESLSAVVAVVSLDGRWVVSGGEQVAMWRLPDGTLARRFRDDEYVDQSLIHHVAAAPDCSWVAAARSSHIIVWSGETGELITQFDAGAPVTALAAAHDGTQLASGNTHGTLQIWSCHGFTLRHRMDGHGRVKSLHFSPDDLILYSGGGGDIRAWDLRDSPADLPVRENAPAAAVLVPRQHPTWVAVALDDGLVQIRDIVTGQITATLTGPGRAPARLAAAPDGTWLATEQGGTITVYDAKTWAIARGFKVQWTTGNISAFASSADGSRLLTVDALAVRAWDRRTGRPLATMTSVFYAPGAVTYSPDGAWLAAGDSYGSIWVWQAASGDLHSTVRGGYYKSRLQSMTAAPGGRVLVYDASKLETWNIGQAVQAGATAVPIGHRKVGIAPDGRLLLAAAASMFGGTPALDQPGARDVQVRYMAGHDDKIAFAFSGDGQWYAVSAGNRTQIWHRTAQSDRQHGTVPGGYRAIALSFDGSRLATAHHGRLQVWDRAGLITLMSFDLARDITAIAFSPDGEHLALTRGDELGGAGTISVLHLESGTERKLNGDMGMLASATESPDGRYLATAGREGLRLWDAQSGQAMSDFYPGAEAHSAAFGPGWIALALWSAAVLIYPLSADGSVTEVPLPDRLERMTVTPDGTRLIGLSSSESVISIDVQTGLATDFARLRQSARALAISPDGQWLAVGGKYLWIFHLADGALVTTHGMNRSVKALDWSPDSSSIAVASDGGSYFFQLTGGS